MNIFNLKDIEKIINCKFNIQKTGHRDWVRAFVLNSQEVTIGRLNFFQDSLYNIKNYKRYYIDTLDETDFIFFRLSRYLKDKTIISLTEYNNLIEQAKEIQQKDLENKINWRQNNPHPRKKHRRRIEKKILDLLLPDYVMNLKKEINYERYTI